MDLQLQKKEYVPIIIELVSLSVECFIVLVLVLTIPILHMHRQVVMLDENGKEMSSEQMADLVADAGITVCTIPNSNQIGRFIILSVHC